MRQVYDASWLASSILPDGQGNQAEWNNYAHAMLAGRVFKGVFTGGPSNTLLTANDLDVALDFESVRACDSRLATGALIVVG